MGNNQGRMEQIMEGSVYTETECDLLNGKLCIANVSLDFKIEDCECSSECGDQWVTEKWQRTIVTDSDIINYKIYNEDTHEECDVFLSAQEREKVIETATQEFLELEQ